MTANKYDEQNNVIERVRFFDGQFLVDYDFIQEQAYHLDRERLHHRSLHLSGIAAGLQVNPDNNVKTQIVVSAGSAIDHDGRQIILGSDCSLDMNELTTIEEISLQDGANRQLYLYLAYNQAQATYTEASQEGLKGSPRWLEVPCFFLYPQHFNTKLEYPDARIQTTWTDLGNYSANRQNISELSGDWNLTIWKTEPPPLPLLLAQVTVDEAGTVTKVMDMRTYAGVRLPGPDDAYLRNQNNNGSSAVSLAFTSPDIPDAASCLTVTKSGRVGIGTEVPTAVLDVSGDLSVTDINVRNNIAISGTHLIYNTPDGVIDWGSGNNGALHFRTLNTQGDINTYTDVMQIQRGLLTLTGNMTVSGNVGIGTTPSDARLNVNGALTATSIGVRTGTPTIDLAIGDNDTGFKQQGDGNLAIYTNNQERVRVDSSGNVGIGTSTPVVSLHVTGPGDPRIRVGSNNSWGEINRWANRIQILSPDYMTIGIGDNSNDVFAVSNENIQIYKKLAIATNTPTIHLAIGDNDTGLQQQGDGNLAIYTNNGERVRIDPWGNVGIGVTAPTTRLDVNGDTRVRGDLWAEQAIYWAAPLAAQSDKGGNKYVRIDYHHYPSGASCEEDMCVSWTTATPSDLRLKKDIQPIHQALDKLKQLTGVTYHWNEAGTAYASQDVSRRFSAGPYASETENQALWTEEIEQIRQNLSVRQIGLIAQDVEKVAPEAVAIDDDGYKRVDYSRLTALLVEAIKALSNETELLKKQLLEISQVT